MTTNIANHDALAQDDLSDCAANMQFWLGKVAGGGTFTANAVATVPVTILGFSAAQTGDLLDIKQTSGGNMLFQVTTVANAVNGVKVNSSATGLAPQVQAQGTDTNIGLVLGAKGSGTVNLQQGSANVLVATGSGTVVNNLLVTGSATNVAVGLAVSGSDTNIGLNVSGKGSGAVTVNVGTALPAAGSLASGIQIGANLLGVFVGSGAPTFSAPQGSLYLRSDGSSTSTRAYIATSGAGAWAAVTTAS